MKRREQYCVITGQTCQPQMGQLSEIESGAFFFKILFNDFDNIPIKLVKIWEIFSLFLTLTLFLALTPDL